MEQKMKAAFKTLEGTFELGEAKAPEITQPDWVIARVKVAGICGTDLRHWKIEEPELKCKIMGHELSGEVVEVGPAVTHVKPGDRVVIETLLGDDTCEWCNIQQYNICPNLYPVRMKTISQAFAQYVAGPCRKFYKLPDHVSFEEATLLDTFSVCMHAIQLSGIKINDKVVVIGAGCIGLGQLQLAKACGADVLITDKVASALNVAKDLGADEIVHTDTEDAHKKVMEFTGGRGADIVFECAGGSAMPVTLPQAVSFTRIGGKVVVVGGFEKDQKKIELDWAQMQKSEIKLILSASYSYWGIYPEMQMTLDLLAKGKLNAQKLITHSFALDDINQAFDTARKKEETGAIFVALKI
ncbi:zinc-dependent alcohol dehydrogenase [Mucilaginibacter phyllosphaerae]|uniref:Alcohol dehydrogenase n=1 Tax=Mucilaginibacter phyllosphaerae TaxID=1812349 RepID=A0A4Y8AAX3_9SPHI|nr:zinc-binding dehydrogenase [Mucilaginibacter phyllosphaerae]MBB3969479.1 L-iditol 2-dehydrogenase [Mucilaginibacter phyllosphaerae]TEW65741.1 alcohol dehydrogenase [Mucilaginibacter phyllosphaerae]GGH08870.1 sorbitol dehydrogenase [Mucilaginibacter phyllosphaerae]